jgi:7-cyano-7-deazaguanine reductase
MQQPRRKKRSPRRSSCRLSGRSWTGLQFFSGLSSWLSNRIKPTGSAFRTDHLLLTIGNPYNVPMAKSPRYTPEHAESGLDAKFPEIETWPNQFPNYEIVIDIPEFTSVCPKTGLPDFGTLWIRYMPNRDCLELKSLKEYLTGYRNLGIFQENIVNRVLEDVVRASKPKWAEVKGEFRPRGGIGTVVIARYPRSKK